MLITDFFNNLIPDIYYRLSCNYPDTNLFNRTDPLEEAIFIILTSQTDERKYLQTWESFQLSFPTMQTAAQATLHQISLAIKKGGLGQWKSKCIKNLLQQAVERYGSYSLDSLSHLDDSPLEKELLRLDGIGIKGARCIMMYSFNRDVFPIDTHCSRILKRIGLPFPAASPRSKLYADTIQKQIPNPLRRRLHINLIQHGRAACKPKPIYYNCCLSNLCKHNNDSIP